MIGAEGRRTVPAGDFFLDWYETALEPGELIEAVGIPPAPPGTVGSYTKLARVAGDFAIASVALVLGMDGGLGDAEIRRLTGALAEAFDPVDDVRASADYRRRVAPRMVRRAIVEAQQRISETP